MIALILSAIPAPVWAGLAAVVALAAAVLTGRRSGTQAAKTKAAEKAADDLQKAKDVRDENAKLSDGAVRNALGKWMRPGE